MPIPVTRALRKLGHDIRDARRRRRLADPRHDAVGRELEEEHLPERTRLSRAPKPGPA